MIFCGSLHFGNIGQQNTIKPHFIYVLLTYTHTLNYICSLCKENDECAFDNILRYEIVSNAFLKVPYSAKFGLTVFFKK